ncbi:small subunit ribosomal protein S6 [Labrys wisconsinensis]|uniref:Small ribosomal subunit protein bS6 n=2 Tax=Labrys wisconsinensis TaxID=425677 RepID=A0ABU0J4A7_9HYPH|nr:small subunit ribosomal protein S6 [Labrys wisconsinensis]
MARQDVTSQQVEALTAQYKGVIEANGGSITKSEYWGVKSLQYRIKKNRKAHFSLFNIVAPPAAIAEMERQMSISEDVIRFVTFKVDELEEGPSAMLRKSDRDERRDDDRGFGFGGGRGGFGGGGRGGFGGDRERPPRRDRFEGDAAQPGAGE